MLCATIILGAKVTAVNKIDDNHALVFWHKILERGIPWWSVLGVHWKDWCWSWNSNTLATSLEELTHWKRPWCWEGLGAGGEGDDRGWDGWMASLTRWTWVWVDFGSWWWTGRPGVLWFMGSQGVGHDWATELNWQWTRIHLLTQGTRVWSLVREDPTKIPHATEKLSQCATTTEPAL